MSSGTTPSAQQPADAHGSEIDPLRALTDDLDLKLLQLAVEAHTLEELSKTLGIPLEICDRRIDALIRMGLLEQRGEGFDSEGDPENVYRRCINSVTAAFDGAELAVTVEDRKPIQNKLDDVWATLADG